MIYKLTFTGDIICQQEQLKAAYKDDQYDFKEVFNGLSEFLLQSDFVAGNLETPLAKGKYTEHPWVFNSPESFAQELKNIGFSFLGTANNHCLDAGIAGLEQTVYELDKLKIDHIGTYGKNKKHGRNKHYLLEEFEDKKVAIMATTYGTNIVKDSSRLKNNKNVDLFRSQESILKKTNYIKRIKNKLFNKGFYGVLLMPNFLELRKQIRRAKKESDYLFVLVHSGGQFNCETDRFTKYIIDKIITNGADVIIGSHPHVVHKIILKGEKVIAYSLGDICSTAGSVVSPFDCYADYSVLINFYLDSEKGMLFNKTSVTIAKNVKRKDNGTRICLVADLLSGESNDQIIQDLVRDSNHILSIISGKEISYQVEQLLQNELPLYSLL